MPEVGWRLKIKEFFQLLLNSGVYLNYGRYSFCKFLNDCLDFPSVLCFFAVAGILFAPFPPSPSLKWPIILCFN